MQEYIVSEWKNGDVTYYKKTKDYILNPVIHRVNGPAMIHMYLEGSLCEYWYLDDQRYELEDFCRQLADRTEEFGNNQGEIHVHGSLYRIVISKDRISMYGDILKELVRTKANKWVKAKKNEKANNFKVWLFFKDEDNYDRPGDASDWWKENGIAYEGRTIREALDKFLEDEGDPDGCGCKDFWVFAVLEGRYNKEYVYYIKPERLFWKYDIVREA